MSNKVMKLWFLVLLLLLILLTVVAAKGGGGGHGGGGRHGGGHGSRSGRYRHVAGGAHRSEATSTTSNAWLSWSFGFVVYVALIFLENFICTE